MKPPAAHSGPSRFDGLLLLVIAVLIVAAIALLISRRRTPKSIDQPVAQTQPANLPGNTVASVTSSAAAATALSNKPGFQERPFPVAYENPRLQWTSADGKNTNVIQQLAHNPIEYARMVEENPRIFKRQLVYLKETAASVFEQAKLTGEPVRQLTLPGVDGRELKFEIVKSEGNGSSRQGIFNGHLAGNMDSMVSFAFQDGREAFTILSPKENIFLVGEPREPGQVIVKAIDPNTYGVVPTEGDDFIKTDSTAK